MSASRITILFDRYINGSLEPGDKVELMDLLADPANEAAFMLRIRQVIDETGNEIEMPATKAKIVLDRILQSEKNDEPFVVPAKKMNPMVMRLLKVAAVVLLVLGAAVVYKILQRSDNNQRSLAKKATPAVIVPGTEKAMLTLADGSVVSLDSMSSGKLAQTGADSIRQKAGLLIYESSNALQAETRYNTLTTPRGGQYRVVLSDGTQVWLNAASSIRYPIAFAGTTREVELTGEAYFEVAKDKSKPFKVNVRGMQVNVLGTHFNVNAYTEEESVKTSLLEGSVDVSYDGAGSRLNPGEQASIIIANHNVKVATVDMDAVVAWKNGLFEFHGADINTVMRQIARWYDVEVVIPAKLASREFEGKISRDAQLSDVLQILELTDIRFRVDGKKIIIL